MKNHSNVSNDISSEILIKDSTGFASSRFERFSTEVNCDNVTELHRFVNLFNRIARIYSNNVHFIFPFVNTFTAEYLQWYVKFLNGFLESFFENWHFLIWRISKNQIWWKFWACDKEIRNEKLFFLLSISFLYLTFLKNHLSRTFLIF